MARHLDAEMSMDHSSVNQLYLPWKPLAGSHTAPRGHLCLPLLTEDSRLFICESDAFLQYPPRGGFLLSHILSFPGWNLSFRTCGTCPTRMGHGDCGVLLTARSAAFFAGGVELGWSGGVCSRGGDR